jgi:hypothetical protein
LFWKVVLVVNGFHRTDWFTGTAINTLIRVNVKHALALIYAVNGALVDTGFVL